ncbi:MAG: hypothetical protein H7199_04765 [Burkholderiales bacterium]|nr:hypothetical protein [Flavobacterium sp.]
MKKVLMLIALVLGTTVMVNAQTAPAKATPAKEVKAVKHVKKAKTTKKVEVKTETTKMETAKPKK